MKPSVQVAVRMPHAAKLVMDRMAKEGGLSRSAVIRRALGIAQICDDVRREGLYVGATSNRAHLKVVIVQPD
jgi:Ribbon-helix-helix protein, copG family